MAQGKSARMRLVQASARCVAGDTFMIGTPEEIAWPSGPCEARLTLLDPGNAAAVGFFMTSSARSLFQDEAVEILVLAEAFVQGHQAILGRAAKAER